VDVRDLSIAHGSLVIASRPRQVPEIGSSPSSCQTASGAKQSRIVSASPA
jgi:hypothetical protein